VTELDISSRTFFSDPGSDFVHGPNYVHHWYHGAGHFITRMNTPLGQYEYDGMRNNAVFRKINNSNFVTRIITDYYKTERQAEGIAYRKKS
jgi:hypothetical protein